MIHDVVNTFCVCCDWSTDDSDDDKAVSRKPRQVRQAASKAVSKQREILLGDGGSEDEEKEEEEQAFVDREFAYFIITYTLRQTIIVASAHTWRFV